MLIYCATAVVVNFTAPMISATFGTTYRELLYLILVVQFIAMPSTYFISIMTEHWSRRIPVFLVVGGWGTVLLLLAYGREQWMVWLIVAVIGCCTGATNATMRSFLAEAVPAGHAEVFFGLMTFIGRMGSAFGPLLFAVVAKSSGEVAALHAILGILVIGMAVLLTYLSRLPGRQALPEAAGPS
jgi:MFS transporter, UMF1 family